jgi:hypothetical protein
MVNGVRHVLPVMSAPVGVTKGYQWVSLLSQSFFVGQQWYLFANPNILKIYSMFIVQLRTNMGYLL